MSSIEKKHRSNIVIHGVLIEIFGTGVLITGESGTGKSECALELISYGHSLVADDVVNVEREENRLFGSAPDGFYGLIEVRGIGICEVGQIFGQEYLRKRGEITLCFEFQEDIPADQPGRASPQIREFELLTLKIPKYVLPATRGRNIPLLIETAVKLYRLKEKLV